jgi:hypothetical protein
MSASKQQSALLGKISALVDFMLCDGRDAFNGLSDQSRDELRTLLGTLNDELRELNAKAEHGFPRGRAVEDSSREANERNCR